MFRRSLALLGVALLSAAFVAVIESAFDTGGKPTATMAAVGPSAPSPSGEEAPPTSPPAPPAPVKPFSGPVKVLPPKGNLIYHGARPDFCPADDCVSTKRVRAFESLAGKDLAFASITDNWFRGIWFPVKPVRAVWAAGAVPYIRIMPRSNFEYGCKTKYTLQRILDGRFDTQLRRYARVAAETGIPLMLSFAGEPNGWWFPWSGVCNGGGNTRGYGDPNAADGPERYRDVWKRLHRIFEEEGALNVTWLYHPNGGSDPVVWWNNLKTYYPGDAYVDWIGTSSYGVQQPRTPYWWQLTTTFDGHYRAMAQVSKTKPLALLEFGVVEDPPRSKAQWITNAFKALNRKRYPRLAAVGWWQSNWRNKNGKWSLVRIDSSKASLAAYRQAVKAPRFTAAPRFSAEPTGPVPVELKR